ncbi:uncharacterized protein LACBIDRAFT_325410 [Laccaria bicolor S238N-H82]|uniref:Predicted protein n=1 Tax=Laccaria bicolor (strain S238N-H82 / ATCC MYA-4686) TaxID=486041 RepID=B0D4U1_LACBS|nr:uncharacterized protein LACBIDRAFT_325410 [Laccaria bicolor S238N-H82]EDR10401.1 predicted protein [Laccaria bicolor S238N-H82]|eukprot:XP_001878851.1 predicted protein [Laccaria bicolor S238N-H82]
MTIRIQGTRRSGSASQWSCLATPSESETSTTSVQPNFCATQSMSLKFCGYGSILERLLVDWSPDDSTSQLLEVDSAIARLSERSRELREQINAKTPFLSLPAEIISEISMMACTPVYTASEPDDFVVSRQLTTPFNLGKTCRTWRHTVWASPRCWNSIFLELRRNAETYQLQVALLEGWLSRSGDLPLCIHLELEDEPQQWTRNPPTEVFDLLARYSHRWLHVSTFLVDPCWKQLEKFSLPRLTSLAVHPPMIGQDAGSKANWRISDAPLLRNACITSFRNEIALPTHQLTQITLQFMDWQDCLSILSECATKLVHCALDELKPGPVHSTSPAAFTLPRLSSFSARCAYSNIHNPVLRLLDCITAPVLSRMQLGSDAEPSTAIRAFLSRSSCVLRELSLNTRYMQQNEPSLIALLADAEKLENLELICQKEGISDLILNHLNPARKQQPAAQVLLPNLRYFHYIGLMGFELGTLVDMIDMRYRMAEDSGKTLGLRSEGDHNRVAKPTVFNINILKVVPSKRASLSASAETLRRLRKEHAGVTLSFSDEMSRARVYT